MYAEAENTLYQLLDNGKMEYGEAVQFYQRLRLKRLRIWRRAGFRWRKSMKEWMSLSVVFRMKR